MAEDVTIYVPLFNLSFNAGALNPAGLIQADGVIHGGASYIATPPWKRPMTTDITGILADADIAAGYGTWPDSNWPGIGHVNLTTRTTATATTDVPFTVILFVNGKFIEVEGTLDATDNWVFTDVSPSTPLAAIPPSDGCRFVSFGQSIIFAAGHGAPVQILLNAGTNFEDCFTSTDKPNFKYVAVIGQRLVFANAASAANDGSGVESAGTPDPNGSLVWWGATNDPRTIGNPDSHPSKNTDFQSILDDQGDITGLSSGKDEALIFKANAIYRLEIGGPYGFAIERVAVGIGCKYPRSITELADDTYFWSNLGPAVYRQGQVLLLGDGIQPMRDMFHEGPAENQFYVLSSASDSNNGLVMWLILYLTNTFTYAVSADGTPTETYASTVGEYALLVYNTISNQFSYAFKQQSNIEVLVDGAPPTTESLTPLTLIDKLPLATQLPLAGVCLVTVDSDAATGDPRILVPYVSSTFDDDPERVIQQDATLTTGFIPFSTRLGVLKAVRPVFKMKRGYEAPEINVTVNTTLGSSAVERVHGPFSSTTHWDDRRAAITTPGVAPAAYMSIEVSFAYKTTGTTNEYAYLIREIEALELIFASGGR